MFGFPAKTVRHAHGGSNARRLNANPRTIGLQAREHHEALQAACKHQTTDEFKLNYAACAGIEGTHEQAIRRCGLRRCHYIGLAKTHLQHIMTAVALNLVRIGAWWTDTPRASTRCSRFAALQCES